MKDKPLIAVPSGDPSGIGPEIAVKCCASKDVSDVCIPVLTGSKEVFIAEAIKAGIDPSSLNFEDTGDLSSGVRYGIVDPSSGQQAYIALKRASDMCMKGQTSAMATPPINKSSLRAAGIMTVGHTELLGEFTKTYDPVTMFLTGEMKIFFLTRHISLMDACENVTFDNVLSGIIRSDRALRLLGHTEEKPLVVAGLNPHNGENGMFGTQERDHIIPAVEEAKRLGINVTGPVPADSVFYLASQGRFCAVLSLYHDQGHIAAKTYDFNGTISMTLGMPYLRTSVDHGTAFDIAGRGEADYNGIRKAVIAAARYGEIYRNNMRIYKINDC